MLTHEDLVYLTVTQNNVYIMIYLFIPLQLMHIYIVSIFYLYQRNETLCTFSFGYVLRNEIAGIFWYMHLHLDYILPNCSVP